MNSHEVFISYATEDESYAHAVCASVEGAGFGCWVSRRDVPAGSDAAALAMEALNSARAVVLIFSSSANRSPEVVREVERAMARRIPIVPFRIENVFPSGSLEYFLSIPHWLDAFEPPFEAHLKRLNHQIGLLLTGDAQQSEVLTPLSRPVVGSKKFVAVILGIVVLLLVVLLGLALRNLAENILSHDVQRSNVPYETAAVDPSGDIKSVRRAFAPAIQEDLGEGISLQSILVPGGEFVMGSAPQELARVSAELRKGGSTAQNAQRLAGSEGPQGQVNVVSFYLGRYEITRDQWERVAAMPKVNISLNAAPSEFRGADHPVENVSWEEAVEFCERITRRTKRNYRLPAEAEWEYACRAGSTAPFGLGDALTDSVAQFNSQFPWGTVRPVAAPQSTVRVDSFRYANAFGLSAMSGNVFEWCQDTWHENYVGSPAGARAWESGGSGGWRVLRGGAFNTGAVQCRCAARSSAPSNQRYNNVGFRIALFSAEIEEN